MVRLEKHLVDAYASGSRWAQYLQVPGGEKFQISFLIFEFSDLVLKTIRNSLLRILRKQGGGVNARITPDRYCNENNEWEDPDQQRIKNT